MRPIELKISAFGAYAKKQVINFDEGLAGSNLFLIHGPTGAGKTTILDSIIFALYGSKDFGNGRDAKKMRSEYADDSTPTEVEFTFSLGDKIYRVKRSISSDFKKSTAEFDDGEEVRRMIEPLMKHLVTDFAGKKLLFEDLPRISYQEAMEKYGSGNYIPDVKGMFWSFRTMVGFGGLMLTIVLITAALAWFTDMMKCKCSKCWLKLLPFLVPLPFIANSVGWYIVEAGRQPWIVVGLQKTAEAVSPNLSPGEVWLTLIGFTAIYLVLAILALFAALHHIRKTKVTEEDNLQ